jgi:hypothetical protein
VERAGRQVTRVPDDFRAAGFEGGLEEIVLAVEIRRASQKSGGGERGESV